MQQEVLKTKFGKQYFSADFSHLPDFLSFKWEGFIPEREEALKGMQITLDMVMKNKVTAILNDNTEGSGPWPITPEDAHKWLKSLETVNLKKLAHVVAEQVFGAMSAKMLEEHEGELTVKYFKTREEAITWLKE